MFLFSLVKRKYAPAEPVDVSTDGYDVPIGASGEGAPSPPRRPNDILELRYLRVTGRAMEQAGTQEVSHPIYSTAERAAIREQLERMLANPLFKNSKRYPNLLRYIVERTLEGSPGELKERTLGIEVFGRSPAYDTN